MLDSLAPAIAFIAVAMIAISFHEAAHAYMAAACGDDTAKRMGRASLNPLRHIDPFGTVLLPGLLYLLHAPFIIGWAKPVPIDWSKLRHWRRDMALVAVAGPAANFTLAALSFAGLMWAPHMPIWAAKTIGLSVGLNLVLGVLNLLPIPPLDGSKILAAALPEKWAMRIAGIRRRWVPDSPPWINNIHWSR